MLNGRQLKEYRELRRVSQYEVCANADITQTMLSQIELGNRTVTQYAHDEIIKGINKAYQKRKAAGTQDRFPKRGVKTGLKKQIEAEQAENSEQNKEEKRDTKTKEKKKGTYVRKPAKKKV